MDSAKDIIYAVLPNGALIWLVFFSSIFALWKLMQPAFKWCEEIGSHIHQKNPGSLNRIFKGTIITGYGIGILVLFVAVFGIWSLDMLKKAVHNAENWEPRIMYIDDTNKNPLKYKVERPISTETEDLVIYLSKKDEKSDIFALPIENRSRKSLSVNMHLLPTVKRYFWIMAATICLLYILLFVTLAMIIGVVKAFWNNLETEDPNRFIARASDPLGDSASGFERRRHNRFEGGWKVFLVDIEGSSQLRSVINLSISGVKLSGGKSLQPDPHVWLKNIHTGSTFSAEILSDTVDSIRLRFIPNPLSHEEAIAIIARDGAEPLDKFATY